MRVACSPRQDCSASRRLSIVESSLRKLARCLGTEQTRVGEREKVAQQTDRIAAARSRQRSTYL